MTVLILFMAELCSKTCGLGRKNLSNGKTFNHPQKIVCYELTLVQWLLTLKCHLFFMGTLTFTEELLILAILSLVRKDSDDSGLQIAKIKYKRILTLSFNYSNSEWTLVHFPSVIIRLNFCTHLTFGPTFNDLHFLAVILLNYLFSNYIIHRIWNSFGFVNGQILVCIRLLSQNILPTRLQMKCT